MGRAEETVGAERRRGRLLRRYFLISLVLVGGGLLTSGLWEIYLRYHEIHDTIASLQEDAAAGAAFRLGQVIEEIHRSVTATTRSRDVTATGFSASYKFELERLLLITPAITEAVALDRAGTVRARASRLRTIIPEDQTDFSASPAFQQARSGATHFGVARFVADGQPFMAIAVPIEHLAGEVVGVLLAEVSLIYIGENVVSRLSDSARGYTYVVNRSGDLLAHPQVSLVLQRREVAHLPQVAQALSAAVPGATSKGTLRRNLQGEQVFSSYAAVANLDWVVFVERPADEVFRPLWSSIRRTATLLLVGLGMTLLASVLVARRVLRPLQVLRGGVERIAGGDLAHRLHVKTGDELESLADEFNRMTARLEEAYAGLEHKVAERTAELVALNEQLDQANRLKSQFLANVSHELRTPMNAIIGFTRLVMRKTEGQIAPLQQDNLHKVLISAEHLLTLINGLLDLAKIEAGRMEVAAVRFRVDEVIHSAAVTVEPLLKTDRVQLIVDVAPDLPPMETDREKLKQIVLNLLSNAAKFTEHGMVKVAAWRTGPMLRIAVADTGIGIPPAALEYIFEEFRQVDMSSTRTRGGTGLGLAIVKKLVHLLHGEVTAESELGKGSTFTVTLPLVHDRAGKGSAA